MFPELSLTPENLSTVLDSMDDGLWGVFSHYVNIPGSEQGRIQSQYSSDRERKQAGINSLISGHPAPSWRLVAHALYQMGALLLGGGDLDSCHRALDRLQQLFPTGTATPCSVCMCSESVLDVCIFTYTTCFRVYCIEDCMQMCVCPVLVLMEWRLCIFV